MTKCKLSTIILSLFGLILVAQNPSSSSSKLDSLSNKEKAEEIVKKSRFVIFPGCEKEDDKYECFANKLQDFIVGNLSKDAKEHLVRHSSNDTVVIYANIHYFKSGYKNLNTSKLKGFVNGFDDYLIPIKNSLPKVEPALDYRGESTSNSVALTLGFILNKQNFEIVPLYGYQPELESKQIKSFDIVENPPVHPNCNQEANNKKKQECLSYNISSFLSNNFNINAFREANLAVGKHRVFVTFKIDTKGNVIEPNARGPHNLVEKEAKRVVLLLPKFKPGHVRGKPVIVPYSLPIISEIQDNTTKKN